MESSRTSIWKHFVKSLPMTLLAMAFTAVSVLAATGTLDSSAEPENTSSYTLEDIYQRLENGTSGTQSTFTEPSSAPGSGTMHTINDIMAAAPVVNNLEGATAATVLDGKTFWGVTNGEWGLQTGTIAAKGDFTGSDGYLTFAVPDGYYSGAQVTAQDADLLAENIKAGVTIFGVTGTYISLGRFVDIGDGTVVDTLSNLMWMENAYQGGGAWETADNFCDSSNFAGYSNWRLPLTSEFGELMDPPDGVSADSPQEFTNVMDSGYWTSSANLVHLNTGEVWEEPTFHFHYFWCVRDN